MSARTQQQTNTMGELTGFQRDLMLAVGALDRPNGLALKTPLETEMGYHEVNHSRLYPNLDRLVDVGYVEKGEANRRTNWYELTERGRRALASKHSEYENALEDES